MIIRGGENIYPVDRGRSPSVTADHKAAVVGRTHRSAARSRCCSCRSIPKGWSCNAVSTCALVVETQAAGRDHDHGRSRRTQSARSPTGAQTPRQPLGTQPSHRALIMDSSNRPARRRSRHLHAETAHGADADPRHRLGGQRIRSADGAHRTSRRVFFYALGGILVATLASGLPLHVSQWWNQPSSTRRPFCGRCCWS